MKIHHIQSSLVNEKEGLSHSWGNRNKELSATAKECVTTTNKNNVMTTRKGTAGQFKEKILSSNAGTLEHL